jgi:putative acetyltransferase
MTDPTPLVRRATAADAEAFARIMGDAEVFPNLMQMPMATEEMWRQRLGGGSDPDSGELRLVAQLGDRVVASAGLHPVLRLRRRHTSMLGISVLPEAQRRGVGRALMQALCDYADQWAQVLRIELTVYTDNARAIALYEAFGFRLEGTHRAYALRRGVYEDVHAMARLHPNPPGVAWPAA